MSVENIIVPELMVDLIWGGSKCNVKQKREQFGAGVCVVEVEEEWKA